MPSPENNTPEDSSPENNASPEMPDDALAGSPSSDGRATTLRRLRPWLIGFVLLAAIPIGITLIGAITSPPHVPGIPQGHFVYLEADSPSEKTTTLRGLFLTEPGGKSRLLTHEYEPQDSDGGVRE